MIVLVVWYKHDSNKNNVVNHRDRNLLMASLFPAVSLSGDRSCATV